VGLRVATNTTAMTASRHLATAHGAMRQSLERLSSGYRINRAADDAAGLAVSEQLRAQLGGMTQGQRNARDAVSVLQTAEGALSASTAILQRMRDLAVAGGNTGAAGGDVTAAVQAEIAQLKAELTHIAEATTFNGIPLLDGTYARTFQVGADPRDTIDVVIDTSLGTAALGLAGVDVTVLGAQAVSTAAARGRGDEPRAGLLVFVGATVAPGGVSGLTGTVTLGGATVDLDALSDTDGDGVVSNREAVDQLNAAALAAGITHRPDPFVDDGDDLVFRGPVPADDATVAELAAATPSSSGTPAPGVLVVEARAADPAAAGLVAFPGSAAAIPSLRGSVSANGRVLDLSAVEYTDTDGDGTVGADEALARLNAAALAAGIMTRPRTWTTGSPSSSAAQCPPTTRPGRSCSPPHPCTARRRRRSPRSTPPSGGCRRGGRTWAPCRTGWSTSSPAWASRWRTPPQRCRGSATPTWPPRPSGWPAPRCSPRSAPRCSPRRTCPRGTSSPCWSDPGLHPPTRPAAPWSGGSPCPLSGPRGPPREDDAPRDMPGDTDAPA
jgi:flagellin